ncbi:MAG: DUF5687 family protein [Mariniphaga sp.]
MNKFFLGKSQIITFMSLEILMMIRNKKPRQNFCQMIMVYIFLTIILFAGKIRLPFDPVSVNFFDNFLLSALSGVFIFLHGLFLLTWESSYFEGLNAGNFDVKSFFKAKYYLLLIGTLPFSLLTALILIFLGKKVLFSYASICIFNTGCSVFIIILYSLFNNERASLNRNIFFNDEGYGMWQYFFMIILIALPGIILHLLSLFMHKYFTIISLCCFGAFSFIFQKIWISAIMKIYSKRKYKILSRFNKTA